ncbi:MAG TPA: hypothetical protein VHT91_16195 [Kofleriaceae bacterium]|nr:hypothetical protein [Kofleriaceae bacterium]
MLREATATAADVAFDPGLLAQLGAAAGSRALAALPLSGHLGARLAVGAAARDARLTVELSGVTGGPLSAPVSQRAELTAGPSGSHLHAELGGGGSGDGALRLGTLDADVPMTVDRWLAEPAAVARPDSVNPRWQFASSDEGRYTSRRWPRPHPCTPSSPSRRAHPGEREDLLAVARV